MVIFHSYVNVYQRVTPLNWFNLFESSRKSPYVQCWKMLIIFWTLYWFTLNMGIKMGIPLIYPTKAFVNRDNSSPEFVGILQIFSFVHPISHLVLRKASHEYIQMQLQVWNTRDMQDLTIRVTIPQYDPVWRFRKIKKNKQPWLFQYYTGWWFGTFFIFPYIRNNHPNWLSYFSEG